MPSYTINGKDYFFTKDIGQDRAEEIIAEREGLTSEVEEGTTEAAGTYQDPKYEGFFTEAGEGVVSGGIGIIQGLAETVSLIPDLTLGTNFGKSVTDFANELRNKGGIDPAGVVGKVTEAVVQFGIPGITAANIVSKAGRVARITKGKPKIGVKRVKGTTLESRELGQDALVKGRDPFLKGRFRKGELRKGEIPFLLKKDPKAPITVARRTKSQKFGLAAQQIAAAGLADAIVSTDGTQTIADFFDNDYIGTDKRVGLQGREEAARRLFNKIKVGLEGGVATAVVPKVVGTTLSGVAKVGAARVPGIDKSAAEILAYAPKKAIDTTKRLILQQEERVINGTAKTLDKAVGHALSMLRHRQFLDPESANVRSIINPTTEANIKIGRAKLKEIDKKIKEVLKRDEFRGAPEIHKKKFIDNFMDVLEGKKYEEISSPFPRDLFNVYKEAKDIIDDLSRQVKNLGVVKELPTEAGKGVTQRQFLYFVDKNIREGGYLTRQYNLFNDKNFNLTNDEITAIADKIVGNRGVDFKHVQRFLSNTQYSFDDAQRARYAAGDEAISEGAAKKYIELVSIDAKRRGSTGLETGRLAKVIINTGLVSKRKVDNEILREIYGEVRNPRESFITTISEISNLIGSDKFYSQLRTIADNNIAEATSKGVKPIFYRTQDVLEREATRRGLASADDLSDTDVRNILKDFTGTIGDYKVLGRHGLDGNFVGGTTASESVYGRMFGYAVPKAMWKSMTSPVYADDDNFGMLLRYIYAPMLKAKGIAQYTKTILSPITQVRNVTSAFGFALANGNVGKDSSVGTSVSVVLRDILGKGNDYTLNYLQELQRRGVIGSSAQLREIQDNLRKGLGFKRAEFEEGQRQAAGRGDITTVMDLVKKDSRAMRFIKDTVKAPFEFAEDLYKGGDDIWKIYSYEFELAKLRNARIKSLNRARNLNQELKYKENFYGHINAKGNTNIDEAMKQHAADVVRNTVPNYELVPEVITGLRGLPLGNFIAFPAEILRTGFNILDTSLRELSSNDAAIREIGMRRLMGATVTFGTVGPGLQSFAQYMTGTSEEEMEAARRLAPYWQRNSTLIPVGRDEKGNLEYIDFSRTTPYDTLSRPFRTVLNQLDTTGKLSGDGYKKVSDTVLETLYEFFQPFADPSIAFEALADVAPKALFGRQGETAQGAVVYRDLDPIMTKAEKIILHMVRALQPGLSPFDIPTGAEFDPNAAKSIKLGRFARGVLFPDEVDPLTGRSFTTAGEIFRASTGLQSEVVDMDKQLKFKAIEFKENRSEAASIFNEIKKVQEPTFDQFIAQWVKADNARLKTFRQFKLMVDDLITLGMDPKDIKKKLRQEHKLGKDEVKSILQDRYEPFKPSQDTIDFFKKKDVQYPKRLIKDLQIQREDIPLSEFKAPDLITSETPDISNLVPPGEDSTTVTPSSASVVAPELPEPRPTNIQTSEVLPSDPLFGPAATRQMASFLGDNPEDILKNLQIARRTG